MIDIIIDIPSPDINLLMRTVLQKQGRDGSRPMMGTRSVPLPFGDALSKAIKFGC